VQTNDNRQQLAIAPKAGGFGSSVNGGELLFLALATCYCNDIYREAARRGIAVEQVEVTVEGDFEAEGAPAANIVYHAKVAAKATKEEIESLIRDTDRVAEIQNTLRAPIPVNLTNIDAVSLEY
jgi:organic hydroperoxide reductase OsmC/OhrA